MSTKVDLQDLLRFLTRDAKVPLALAMGKIKDLRHASLTRYLDNKCTKLQGFTANNYCIALLSWLGLQLKT